MNGNPAPATTKTENPATCRVFCSRRSPIRCPLYARKRSFGQYCREGLLTTRRRQSSRSARVRCGRFELDAICTESQCASMTPLLIFVFVLAGTCSANERQFIAAEFSDSTALQAFLLDPFEKPIGRSMVLSDAKEEVLQRFGEPQQVEIVSIPDRYADGDITHSTLHYAGSLARFERQSCPRYHEN